MTRRVVKKLCAKKVCVDFLPPIFRFLFGVFQGEAFLTSVEANDVARFGVENAPTCYRAPRWPNPGFPRKIPKKIPPPEILDSQNLPPKYPKNTLKNAPKIPKLTTLGIFSVFWGYFLGVPEFRTGGVFFRYFFAEIPGRAISGLCRRTGRS